MRDRLDRRYCVVSNPRRPVPGRRGHQHRGWWGRPPDRRLDTHYAAFIGAYTVLRLVMTTFIGPVLAVGLALVGAAILVPLLARLTFRVVGVRITSADPATGPGVA